MILFPATPFVKEAVGHFKQGYRPAAYEKVREQIHSAARRTTADAQGNFEFRELPPGDYLLEVSIYWVYGGSQMMPLSTGSIVKKFATVTEGQSVRVLLTE